MRESKKSEGGGGAFKAPPPDRIGLIDCLLKKNHGELLLKRAPSKVN